MSTSFSEAGQNEGFGFLQRGDGLLAGDAGILFEEFI